MEGGQAGRQNEQNHRVALKKYQGPFPSPGGSDSVNLSFSILQSFPGDSSAQPELRTSGLGPAGREILPELGGGRGERDAI